MAHVTDFDRREFLTAAATAAGGLLLGIRPARAAGAGPGAAAVGLTAFVEIAPDGAVTIASKNM
ncbi:MAG TPA: twin-arginine translocation signal domain-containing protein, partial [Gemmatimonadales bacterium]